MKHLKSTTALLVAFVFGVVAARTLLPHIAQAQSASVAPMSLDLNTLQASDFTTNPALPNLRTKPLVTVDQTQIAYQIGVAPKHTHAQTTEVQLILEGEGTEWLGDKQIAIHPGSFIVIPPNTVHGGFAGGPFNIYTVKTPPQQPTDFHPVP